MKRFTLPFSRAFQRFKELLKPQKCASCGQWYGAAELDPDGICYDCGRYL